MARASLLGQQWGVIGDEAPFREGQGGELTGERTLHGRLGGATSETGQESVHLERLSLREAISAVVTSWDGESNVEADVEPSLFVLADRARFKRVLANRAGVRAAFQG